MNVPSGVTSGSTRGPDQWHDRLSVHCSLVVGGVDSGPIVFLAAAVVLVQIIPSSLAERYGELLITACTQGLREGACVLAGEAPTSHRPSTVLAEVRWEDETFRVAVIRLGQPNLGEREWSHGKVAFDEDDALPDRFTTAGFTIATLAGDLATRPEQSVPPKETTPPAPRRSQGSAERIPSQRRPGADAPFRASAGYTLGQAMQDQPVRTGPWLSVAYAPFAIPVAARVRGAAAWVDGGGAAVRWLTGAAGLETRLPANRALPGMIAAADAGASLVTASSERRASRVSAAFSLFLGGDLRLAGPLSIVAGGEMTIGPATTLRVDSRTIADRRVKFGGIVGLAASL